MCSQGVMHDAPPRVTNIPLKDGDPVGHPYGLLVRLNAIPVMIDFLKAKASIEAQRGPICTDHLKVRPPGSLLARPIEHAVHQHSCMALVALRWSGDDVEKTKGIIF